MNDILINKIQSIQRCIRRAREEYRLAGESFKQDYSHQDAAILNIIRACELAIDLANHIIKTNKLGIPTSSRESFERLAEEKIITRELCDKMQNMIGFRNIAIHQYQKLNLDILIAVIMTNLADLETFTDSMMAFDRSTSTERVRQ